jgi:hypothetical protein
MSNRTPRPTLSKVEAGNYIGRYRGYEVQVIEETTRYGDHGWNAYLHRETGTGVDAHVEEGQVTDYPMYTRREALAVGCAAVDHRVSEARRRLYAAALQEVSY